MLKLTEKLRSKQKNLATQKKCGGRPSKLSQLDQRHLLLSLKRLRENEVLFTSKRIQIKLFESF